MTEQEQILNQELIAIPLTITVKEYFDRLYALCERADDDSLLSAYFDGLWMADDRTVEQIVSDPDLGLHNHHFRVCKSFLEAELQIREVLIREEDGTLVHNLDRE
jgi:hypothetical protein